MVFKKDICSNCNNMNTILPSNNKLVPDLCDYCINQKLDYNNIEDADFFCRTFNYPFDPEKWIKLSKMYKKDTFKEYISWIKDEDPFKEYHDENNDVWKKVNEEWQVALTHEELINQIEPIKEDYLKRNRIKWGSDYVFQELISLENLFVNTLKANDISNPMQIDAIKKACKLSVELDRAIISRDSKIINELSKSYQNFIKTAQIDTIITSSSKDVISNVSELVAYIEEQDFEMQYYDNVERDIVDKSMKDMKDYIRRLITDATGFEAVFEQINDSLKKQDEILESAESYERVPLDNLYEASKKIQNEETDAELAEDDIDEDFIEEDEYENDYFGE